MVEPVTREVQRCELCDTPLRFLIPDKDRPSGARILEFTAHSAAFCRDATLDRIATLMRVVADSARELMRSEKGRHHEAIVNRRLRDRLDERAFRTHLPVPDRDGERRFWSGSNGAVSYYTVAKDSVAALKFLIDHEVQCGYTDETHDMGVEEVPAEKAATIRIGGDDPTLLSAMPYGDVARSEY